MKIGAGTVTKGSVEKAFGGFRKCMRILKEVFDGLVQLLVEKTTNCKDMNTSLYNNICYGNHLTWTYLTKY